MKKNVQSLGLGFLFLLIVLAASKCEAQRNLTGRQLKFETGVQHAIDTVEATGNEGRIWYDFVTGKFRANQGGINTGLIGGGGGGSFVKTTGTSVLGAINLQSAGVSDGQFVMRNSDNSNNIEFLLDNGLNGADFNIDLSSLVGDYTVNQYSTASDLLGTASSVFSVSNFGVVNSLTLDGNGLLYTSGSTIPITYGADYSANYSDRSLPDWGNVWRTGGTTTLKDGANAINIGTTDANSLVFQARESYLFIDNTIGNGAGSVQLGASYAAGSGSPNISVQIDPSNYLTLGEGFTITVNGVNYLQVKNNGDVIYVLPVNCTGKASGTLYNDAGDVKICP